MGQTKTEAPASHTKAPTEISNRLAFTLVAGWLLTLSGIGLLLLWALQTDHAAVAWLQELM